MTIEAIDARPYRSASTRESELEQRLHYLDVEARILSRRVLQAGVVAAHLVVAPSGVWVIAARRFEGRPTPQGGVLSRRTQLIELGNRTATRLVAPVARQAELVRDALGAHANPEVPVSAMLCILDADWPMFGGSFTVDGVRVLWPERACEAIETGHHLDPAQIRELNETLANAFPATTGRHPAMRPYRRNR